MRHNSNTEKERSKPAREASGSTFRSTANGRPAGAAADSLRSPLNPMLLNGLALWSKSGPFVTIGRRQDESPG
jgi:hypothetical protein